MAAVLDFSDSTAPALHLGSSSHRLEQLRWDRGTLLFTSDYRSGAGAVLRLGGKRDQALRVE